MAVVFQQNRFDQARTVPLVGRPASDGLGVRVDRLHPSKAKSPLSDPSCGGRAVTAKGRSCFSLLEPDDGGFGSGKGVIRDGQPFIRSAIFGDENRPTIAGIINLHRSIYFHISNKSTF
jgi:hypothetical protein